MSPLPISTSSETPDVFQDALAERLLLAPPGTNRLSSVSGYVSPSALLSCLYQMDLKATPSVEVQVVIGMAGAATVTYDDHVAYRKICERFPDNVSIRYTPRGRVIHSKVYVWSSRESPMRAFLGSANFTRQGIGINSHIQENLMCEVDAAQASKYVQACWDESIDCLDPIVHREVTFIAANAHPAENLSVEEITGREIAGEGYVDQASSRDFYLYSRKKMNPYGPGGGINWGISNVGRKRSRPDEAYFSVPTPIVNEQFFPQTNTPFLVHCDDGEILIMRLASGKSGKDITTLPHNDELGRYIRRRMGLPSGKIVGVKELLDYRRGHVRFTRLGETEYRLDFSQPSAATGIDSDLQQLSDRHP